MGAGRAWQLLAVWQLLHMPFIVLMYLVLQVGYQATAWKFFYFLLLYTLTLVNAPSVPDVPSPCCRRAPETAPAQNGLLRHASLQPTAL